MNAKEKIRSERQQVEVAFDVGHSSIGWAVLKNTEILGCGAVTFRADDCLASGRRGYRRQRRHIRSTRYRIERMKVLLLHLGAMTREELDRPGCAWPWLSAARVLASKSGQNPAVLLTWPELWDVLRWYAHNRGYDGNRRWSATQAAAQAEDTEKEENARGLMAEFGTRSMAETVCAVCGIDPFGAKKSCNVEPAKRFKGKNAAFPRDVVEKEVRRVLQIHAGKLRGVDANLERTLCDDWQAISCKDLKLPRRYAGGLLFGQAVPRFDNRIISTCPITYQKVFAGELAKGADEKAADHTATKLAKVPTRNCPEFLNFRWAMQLANIRVARFGERELTRLNPEERKHLDGIMRNRGAMGVDEFKTAVRQKTSAIRDNLDAMFMHPDAKEALLLDSVQRLVTNEDFAPFWQMMPERLQKRLRGKWRQGKSFSLRAIREEFEKAGGDTQAFDTEVQRRADSANTRTRNKPINIDRNAVLDRIYPAKRILLDGRGPFSRELLKQAYFDVMAGKHPKEEGGCLYLSDEIRQAQLQREIDQQTNNHLVRHRLLMLQRLLQDIIGDPAYANGDKNRISKITIEVNRDLRDMSGKTAKEKAQDLGLRLANHHHVAERLEEALAEERFNGKPIPVTAGLIRKARIADDLGWKCPYTGVHFEPKQLVTRVVDKDHIVPRSDRVADSLDSLVVTFAAINKWKGKRTAWQFVSEEQGKPVPSLPNLSILSLNHYKQFVEALDTRKGHSDDRRRKERRKRLLLLSRYEEQEFTPGDLTQTSQLVRLGAQAIKKVFAGLIQPPIVVSLPGAVTGVVRKSWKMLGCLSTAAPQVLDQNGEVRTKTEIRDITHLHHALDACVLAFASHFIPNNGHVWELILKRNLSSAEKQELVKLEVFGFNVENRFQLRDLDDRLKEQIRQRLAEKRVVQHISARMDGLRVEQNTWRVRKNTDGIVLISQKIRQPDGSLRPKEVPEKQVKLLGLMPLRGGGKLAAIKGVLVIPDNFGVAILDQAAKPEDKFVIIPWHLVHSRLFKGFKDSDGNILEKSIIERNGGKMPRILRNGQIVRVSAGTYKGVWKVTSIKNQKTGVKLNLGQPDTVNTEEEVLDSAKKKKVRKVRPDCRHEASLASIVSGGLEIFDLPLTGFRVQAP